MSLEKALQSYMNAFDESYPLVAPMEMSDIEQCIQALHEPPTLEEDIDY